MAIPDYQTLMRPLLHFASDGNEHTNREVFNVLAAEFNLSDDEQNKLLPSGRQSIFKNRIGWAKSYLKQASLLEFPRRGSFCITSRGLQVLKANPERIDITVLTEFSEFQTFRKRTHPTKKVEQESPSETPEELLESAYQSLRVTLVQELLDSVKQGSPSLFERVVVELLVKMGYGGSRQDAGKAIGKSGDEGIDGVIKEDRLGLDVVYIQAKRWEQPVGRPEVQKFVGALQGQRARKGILITTSEFSKKAHSYVQTIENKIVLINGEQLANHMIDYGLGVSSVASYEVKKLDSDYFTE